MSPSSGWRVAIFLAAPVHDLRRIAFPIGRYASVFLFAGKCGELCLRAHLPDHGRANVTGRSSSNPIRRNVSIAAEEVRARPRRTVSTWLLVTTIFRHREPGAGRQAALGSVRDYIPIRQ